jgi:uncharacterized protein (DUF433 family)
MDPSVCHGKPCVRGLRYPVEVLLELLSSGMTIDEILADYEDLEREDLLAVQAYPARFALTPFWIEVPNWSHAPLGYGVTAHSLEDAIRIILSRGYCLPEDKNEVRITQHIRYSELTKYVREHMGPIVVRGMWYPFYRLGE